MSGMWNAGVVVMGSLVYTWELTASIALLTHMPVCSSECAAKGVCVSCG